MPPGLSPMHLLVIFVVALVVLGPERMPEAARKGAQLLGQARGWSARISGELERTLSEQAEGIVASAPEPSSTPGSVKSMAGSDSTLTAEAGGAPPSVPPPTSTPRPFRPGVV